ncbi:MAG TPA: signal peptidase II [Hyphomicrobiaceae bacterium]|nr:signal peptidase II [Hyphomicrobiaceae bacterium]
MSSSTNAQPPSAYLIYGLAIALAALFVDQAHKWAMIKGLALPEGQRFQLAPFLDIIYVRNTGISYGWLSQSSTGGQWALAGFAVLAAIGLSLWLARGVSNRLLAASVGLIIGGAMGNAIDRVVLGGVADFFSLHAFGYYWYVFNIADVAIVAGVVGMLWESIIGPRMPGR